MASSWSAASAWPTVARSSTEVLRYDGSSLLKDNTRTPTSLVVRSARRSVGAGLGRRLRRHRARAAVGRGLRGAHDGLAEPGQEIQAGQPLGGRQVGHRQARLRVAFGRPDLARGDGHPAEVTDARLCLAQLPRGAGPHGVGEGGAERLGRGVRHRSRARRGSLRSTPSAGSVVDSDADGRYCSTSRRSSPSGVPPPAGLRRQLGSRSGGVAAPGQPRWRSSPLRARRRTASAEPAPSTLRAEISPNELSRHTQAESSASTWPPNLRVGHPNASATWSSMTSMQLSPDRSRRRPSCRRPRRRRSRSGGRGQDRDEQDPSGHGPFSPISTGPPGRSGPRRGTMNRCARG